MALGCDCTSLCIGEGPADLDGDAVKAGCLAIVKDRYGACHDLTLLHSITSSGETHWLRQRAFGLDFSTSRRQPPNPRRVAHFSLILYRDNPLLEVRKE